MVSGAPTNEAPTDCADRCVGLKTVNDAVDHVLGILHVFTDLPDAHGVVLGSCGAEIPDELVAGQPFAFAVLGKGLPDFVAHGNPAFLFLGFQNDDFVACGLETFKTAVLKKTF